MCIVMITKEGSTRIVNFITQGTGALVLRCDHISHVVKMHYFFKSLLICSGAYFRQTKCIAMMDKERVNQNCKFHDPRVGFLC